MSARVTPEAYYDMRRRELPAGWRYGPNPEAFLRETLPAWFHGVPLAELDGVPFFDMNRRPSECDLTDWRRAGLYTHDMQVRCFRLTDAGRAAVQAARERLKSKEAR